jgi:hypothetical protein
LGTVILRSFYGILLEEKIMKTKENQSLGLLMVGIALLVGHLLLPLWQSYPMIVFAGVLGNLGNALVFFALAGTNSKTIQTARIGLLILAWYFPVRVFLPFTSHVLTGQMYLLLEQISLFFSGVIMVAVAVRMLWRLSAPRGQGVLIAVLILLYGLLALLFLIPINGFTAEQYFLTAYNHWGLVIAVALLVFSRPKASA